MARKVLLRVLRPTTFWIAALGIVAFAGSAAAYRDPPPDASGTGPNATAVAEYKLDAVIDPDIIAGRFTEVWARVYRPDPLPDNSPLLVFLHGNHSTCGRCITGTLDADAHCTDGSARHDDNSQYTTSGTCPAGYAVTPNHAGYGYLATQLASWGYLVVSINVNRGINAGSGIVGDGGLNLVRGRMILRHLELLSRWNQGLDPTPPSLGIDLTGKIDFSNVGLMGHSRGGEGIRAAYQQYRDSGSIWPPRIGPVNFNGMFEIGPVDGQTSRVLTPDGTTWEVSCRCATAMFRIFRGFCPMTGFAIRSRTVRRHTKETRLSMAPITTIPILSGSRATRPAALVRAIRQSSTLR
jgi:hypothetical protein